MAKDYARRVFLTRQTPKKNRWRLPFVIFLALIVVLGSSYWIYLSKCSKPVRVTEESVSVTESSLSAAEKSLIAAEKSFIATEKSFWSRMLASIKTHKKTHEDKHVQTAQKKNAKPNAETEVHFDFYNELPNMQVTIPETKPSPVVATKTASTSPVPTTLNQKKVAEMHLKNDLNMLSKEAVPTPKILDPEAPLPVGEKRSAFILQIGLFKQLHDAKESRVTLLLSGCEAQIVTIKTPEGFIYRLQRGPFINEAEAKKLQRYLQRKGIETILKKA